MNKLFSLSKISEVENSYHIFGEWLFNKALPVWGSVGCDGNETSPAYFGAHESLTLKGEPAHAPFKRMRVQARQLYTFIQATYLGWEKGRSLADSIYRFMLNGYLHDGRWVRSLTPIGDLLDPVSDLYDIAFIIFSLSWYARLTGQEEPVHFINQTISWMNTHMRGEKGGYENTYPVEEGPRQQNPHMHLLEAALALYETTKDTHHLAFIEELVTLFNQRLYNGAYHSIGEFFEKDWKPCEKNGHWVEPGHHYEWIWLLTEYSRITGNKTFGPVFDLYQFNTKYGHHPETRLVYDAVNVNGVVLKKSSRLWAQTEALRAEIALMKNNNVPEINHATEINKIIDNLMERYFSSCPDGMWIDQLDEKQTPVADKIPASSFYHIMAGYVELSKLFRVE